MPDRLIRDELLDSDRYWSLPDDTHRLLFDHFMLTADDLGNAEATTGTIRRRLLQRPLTPDECAKMLTALHSVDILRVYEIDGKRYVHIPRFRQRLRSYKKVNPRPPAEIEDNEIKQLLAGLSDKRQSDDGHKTDTSPSLAVEGSEGSEGSEVDISNGLQKTRVTTAAPKPPRKTVLKKSSDPKANPKTAAELEALAHSIAQKFRPAPPPPPPGNGLQRVATAAATPPIATPSVPGWSLTERGIQQRAMELGLPAHAGEGWKAWAARLIAADAALPASQRRG